MLATPSRALAQEEEEDEEDDNLFGDEGDEPMDTAPVESPQSGGGVKRKLAIDEDYDD